MLVRKVADRMIQIKICIHHTYVLTQVANETQSGFFFARQRRTGTNLSHGGTSAHYLRYGLVLVHGFKKKVTNLRINKAMEITHKTPQPRRVFLSTLTFR